MINWEADHNHMKQACIIASNALRLANVPFNFDEQAAQIDVRRGDIEQMLLALGVEPTDGIISNEATFVFRDYSFVVSFSHRTWGGYSLHASL